MSNSVLSFIGWTFLPNLVTGWVQSLYYSLTIRAGDRRPLPNTPRYAEHRRRIYIAVVTLYLLYTIYEADYVQQKASSFYVDLGVPFAATEREIKSRFRRLAALHHPDKVGADGGAGDLFMHLKKASDTLLDPASRFAYERFGPQVVEWQHCSSVRDYVLRGVQQQLLYYAVAAAGLYGMGLLGYLDWGRYWRWVTLAVLCAVECHVTTRPTFPRFLELLVNPFLRTFTTHAPLLPFQLLDLARRASITLFIAFSQIGPQLQPVGQQGTPADKSEKALQQSLERLEGMTTGMDVDATRLMELEMSPFAGDPDVIPGLRKKLKEWLVQNTIRNDPMVRDALGQSFQKRRVDAPAGARGTR